MQIESLKNGNEKDPAKSPGPSPHGKTESATGAPLLRTRLGWQHFHTSPTTSAAYNIPYFKRGFLMSHLNDSVTFTHYYLFYPLWALRKGYYFLQQLFMIWRLNKLFLLRLKNPILVKLTAIFHYKEWLFSAFFLLIFLHLTTFVIPSITPTFLVFFPLLLPIFFIPFTLSFSEIIVMKKKTEGIQKLKA